MRRGAVRRNETFIAEERVQLRARLLTAARAGKIPFRAVQQGSSHVCAQTRCCSPAPRFDVPALQWVARSSTSLCRRV